VSSVGGPLLFATIALVLIMLGSVWIMNRASGAMVGAKHRVLQEIVETGQVPAEWSRSYRRKLAWLEKRGSLDQIARVKLEAQQHYLDKLEELLQYARTTPLVDGEDTRDLLLRRLQDVRAEWQKKA
jgi:hypothetical protein